MFFANICRYTIELFGEGAVFVVMAEIIFENDGQQGDIILINPEEGQLDDTGADRSFPARRPFQNRPC